MNLEVAQICRTCLAMESKLLSIYQTKAFANIGYVSDVLKELTNMEPNKTDGYPGNVCLECIREINRCYSFKLKCENSYAILRQIFGITEEQPEKSEEKTAHEKQKKDSPFKILNQIVLLPTSSNLNVSPSKDTETIKENPRKMEPLKEPKTKKRKLDSGLKILNHQMITPSSSTLNSVSTTSEQTEASFVVCSKNQIKEAAEVVETSRGNDDIDSFDMMIEKLVFEDEDCPIDLDTKSWLSPQVIDSETNKQHNKEHSLNELETQPNRVNGHSQCPDSESLKNNSLNKYIPSLPLKEHDSIDKSKMQLSIKCSRYKPEVSVNKSKKKKQSLQCPECGKGNETNKNVSSMCYYAYRLMIRNNLDNYILRYRQLYHQYVVDMFAKIESERLRYLRFNQAKLRSEDYIHLRDAIIGRNDENLNINDIDNAFILPSSYIGSPRNMQEYVQDAMTYLRHYGRPDLFITFTCNPKWKEKMCCYQANNQYIVMISLHEYLNKN